jgi:hypothetical protein
LKSKSRCRNADAERIVYKRKRLKEPQKVEDAFNFLGFLYSFDEPPVNAFDLRVAGDFSGDFSLPTVRINEHASSFFWDMII